MSALDYTGVFIKSHIYCFASKKKQLKIQKKNLNNILKFAKGNSDYYKDKINDNLDFEKIPPISKNDFVENFDQIVTDKNVTYDRVKSEISKWTNPNIDGKYSITYTSGSTGNPTIILQDKYFQNMTSIVTFFRFLSHSLPIIMIGEENSFGCEAEMIKHNQEKTKLTGKFVRSIDVKDPIDQIISKLKEIGPGTIIGYPGAMTLMANKLLERNIFIKEKKIFLSGEYSTEADKELLRKAFLCDSVYRMYGCTEAGLIASECKEGHMHIAADCVKIEPIDENNNLIGYDKLSDRYLLTNLMNRIQPIIRYEVTDKIILHKGEKCSCGCKDDWIEIEGRTNDNLVLLEGDKEIVIPSIILLIVISEVNKDGIYCFRNYKLTVSKDKKFHFILDYIDKDKKEEINQKIIEKLDKFLSGYGVSDIKYEFEDGVPTKTSRGKYKKISMC